MTTNRNPPKSPILRHKRTLPYLLPSLQSEHARKRNTPLLVVSFALGAGPEHWPYHIIHNDPGHTVFLIHAKKGLDGSIYDLTLDGSIAGYWNGSKREKCGWRDIKVPTTEDKVVRQVIRYFDNLKEIINELDKR